MQIFDQHARDGTFLELDEVFMDLTMDVINYYLYGRSDLNYDMVGGRANLKVQIDTEEVRSKLSLTHELYFVGRASSSGTRLPIRRSMAPFWHQPNEVGAARLPAEPRAPQKLHPRLAPPRTGRCKRRRQ